MSRRARLASDGPVDRRRLERLVTASGLTLQPGVVSVSAVYDTDDRVLAAAGLALEVQDRSATLWAHDGSRIAACRSFDLHDGRWTAPRGRLRSELRARVAERPLRCVHTILRAPELAVGAGGDEAWRVVTVRTNLAGVADPIQVEATISAIHGERTVRRALGELGLTTQGHPAIVAVERAVGAWTGGKGRGVLLDGGAPASVTARRVMAPLYDRMVAHEAGVLADADPEHLHDWRVALRSARAALSLLSGALPGRAGRSLRGRLRELQASTGALRDLDVTIPVFDRWIQEAGADGAPLRAWLGAEREAARREVTAVLTGGRYRKTLRRWREVIEDQGIAGDEGHHPTAPLIRLKVHEAWSRLVEEGEAIGPDAPDEALHELRKSGKRLRYLLELFGSTLPASPTKSAVKLLKSLQDTLGHFQDEAVRATWLGDARAALGSDALIGALLDRVDREHAETRASFDAVFRRFRADGAPLLAEVTGTTRAGHG